MTDAEFIDYAALEAMQVAHAPRHTKDYAAFAADCYDLANAMLAERKRREADEAALRG